MSDKVRIKCRFCEWSTPRWFRLKTGTLRGPDYAWVRLNDHVMTTHSPKHDSIEAHCRGKGES